LRENYSATSRRTFGAIGLAPPDDPGTLTMLMLHEFQHMKLGALLDMVDLYRPGGVARHEAPWRSDPRPVSALLQGTYAHLAVADFWRVHRQAGDGDVRRAELQFAYWRLQVQAALKSLVASGELTRHGRVFSGHLADTTSAFAAETVSASAQLAAQTCALARSAAWQLTNRQVSQAEVERLARAWRAGEPCPPVEPPLVVAPPSANPGQPRLAELVMGDQDVRAAGSGPDPSPGDTALLAGDPVLAARRYARSISRPVADAASATRNNDMDQWIGLAVSLAINGHGTALVGQLGLIRAAYSALAAEPGGPPSPEALARWCDRPPGTGADPAAAG